MKKYFSIIFPATHRLQQLFRVLLLGITLATGGSLQGQTKNKAAPSQGSALALDSKSTAPLSHEIISVTQNSFGYNILSGTKILVHQPSIPGLPGNRGFTKKEDAEKCARLVLNKINNNIMPPTVTRQELDSLKIKL